MCAAIEATPTSGRRALTQLIRAARVNGSGSVAAPSATRSQMVGRPAELMGVRSSVEPGELLGGGAADANPDRRPADPLGARSHLIGGLHVAHVIHDLPRPHPSHPP